MFLQRSSWTKPWLIGYQLVSVAALGYDYILEGPNPKNCILIFDSLCGIIIDNRKLFFFNLGE